MNPAREVKTERFSRTEGKTPAFVEGEVQKLLDADRDIHAHRPPRSRSGPCLHLRPDRRRREPEGRRLWVPLLLGTRGHPPLMGNRRCANAIIDSKAIGQKLQQFGNSAHHHFENY
jgi:hypothetical protein